MTTIKKQALRIALECLVVGLLLAGTAVAQTFTGSIGGIVKDSSGAVVPGVKVVVMEKATKMSQSTDTNGAGVYLVSFLDSGAYQVTFSKEGFKTDVEENVPLVLNQKARVDVVLVVGSATQSVTVTATAPQIDRESAAVGATVENSDLVKYPESIGSHGPTELVLIKIFPGMSGSSPTYSNPNNISETGGRPDTTPIIIDGLPSNMGADNTYGLVPTPDTTGEMQVIMTPYSAQYGQTGGGAVLTTTKSGTNDFHGNLFEYHNDQGLNAVDFFSKHPFVKAENIFNYFGGAVGGPVYIPGVWNGRKRHTFFFADMEDTINFKPGTLNTDVPTAAQRQGNFSGTEANGTAPPTNYIYNPATTVVNGSTISRTVFAGNIITTAPDPIGAKLLAYYPLPTPNTCTGTANYCVTPPGYHSYLYVTDRVDQEVGESDRLWFRYAQDGPWGTGIPYYPNAANTSFTGGWRDYHAAATWVHIFSPTITNEFRLGEVEEDNFTLVPSQDVSSLGMVNVPATQFPSIGMGTGYNGMGGGGAQSTIDRHQIFNDELQMQRGRHSLHVGGEYMRYMDNQWNPGNLAGNYSFTGSFTSAAGSTANGTGNAVADLYLGEVASASFSTNNYTFRYRMNYASLYGQDDFKLTPKLTLNFGLRWEFDGPTTEVNNWLYSMLPNITDPTTGDLGAVEFAGRNGYPRHFMPNDLRGFLPRAGFAYGIGHNTVLRAGAGLFELPSIGFVTTGSTSEYSRSCSFTAPNNYTPVFQLQAGIGNCPFNQSAAGLPNLVSSLTSPKQAVTEFQTHGNIPLLQEWSLGLQHQFTHGWVGEIDFVGNKGTHLPVSLPMDQIVPTPGCCNGVSNAQSLRPFPQWNGVSYFSYTGNSNYNGLILRMQHNWSQGLSTLFTYTYAKTMDDVDASARSDAVPTQNVYNIASQYGVAMIDIPQRFTAAYVWLIPIGSGGKLVANVPGVSQLLGHWEFSGITQFQPGYPYVIGQSNLTGLFNGSQYTSRTGISTHLPNPIVAQWFNPAAFIATPADTFGTTPRASLFGPGLNNFDISVSRNFPIKERITIQFRGDFYNAFNHVQFDNLNTTLGNSTFGAATGDTGARTVQLDARIRF